MKFNVLSVTKAVKLLLTGSGQIFLEPLPKPVKYTSKTDHILMHIVSNSGAPQNLISFGVLHLVRTHERIRG